MKKILLICLCIILIVGGVVLMIPNLLSLKFRGDTLRSCSVETGGGMLGGHREVSLRRDGNGNAVLRVSEKEMHADRLVTTECRVDEGAFDRVRKLVDACYLYAASKRPYSRMRVLDGDTTSVSFSYDKDSFRVSEEQVISRKMRSGMREVIRILETLEPIGETVTTKEQQKAVLYLKSGYTLQFLVEDAFDGKTDEIFEEEREVSVFRENGIVLASDVQPDVSGAESAEQAAAGDVVYDPQGGQIIVLYADCTFDGPVYVIARIVGDADLAKDLIAEMEGEYKLFLN